MALELHKVQHGRQRGVLRWNTLQLSMIGAKARSMIGRIACAWIETGLRT